MVDCPSLSLSARPHYRARLAAPWSRLLSPGFCVKGERRQRAGGERLANRVSNGRMNSVAASALSITIKSLSCRLRPDAEKFAPSVFQTSAVPL